jgi:hypothetical protein
MYSRPEDRSSMRVRYLDAQHLRSARCPLRWYFVRKFRFSAELMVSYFNLMIASDLCFATTPVDAWHEHDLIALGLMALGSRCTDLDRWTRIDP